FNRQLKNDNLKTASNNMDNLVGGNSDAIKKEINQLKAKLQSTHKPETFKANGWKFKKYWNGKLTAKATPKAFEGTSAKHCYGLFSTEGLYKDFKAQGIKDGDIDPDTGWISGRKEINITDFQYDLDIDVVKKMYEGKPQEELDNYLIKRGEVHTERMQKAEEEKRLAQAKYDNERTYYGQKESEYLGGDNPNTNEFCTATGMYNLAADTHRKLNGELPTRAKGKKVLENIVKEEKGVRDIPKELENGGIERRGYVFDDIQMLNESSKGLGDDITWKRAGLPYDNYDDYKKGLSETKGNTGTVINFKTGKDNQKHTLTVLSETTITITDPVTKKETKKAAFNFVDNWNGNTENKRSVWDTEKKNADGTKGGYVTVTGPIPADEINQFRLYTYK
ncbi:MAG: hypothetical protein MJB14_07740, partial [Spirochaetes bacterium]|nr:hypothetical protein [Spirochaetota bacterium]